tara:strand:+ start:825 stop:1181 length:357 start_codon:yes stop_codon:yes gene_type:complete
MANMERLTKRVKKVEEWIEENEDMGGPKGLLETMSFLVNEARRNQEVAHNAHEQFNTMRGFMFGFLEEQELGNEWDEYLKKKDEERDAVQKQEAEEISVQEETEDSKETSKTSEEKEE